MAKKKPQTPSSQKVDFDTLKTVSDFMKAQGLTELSWSGPGIEIHLKREIPGYSAAIPALYNLPAAAPQPSAPALTNGVTSSDSTPAKKNHVVTSPFVGTFYRAAGPNQDPFVEVGRVVDNGDRLCIVEAMKLMNEIESDAKGRIAKVLVENGTPVEFGEPLFEIEAMR